jgi:hypothetical protein
MHPSEASSANNDLTVRYSTDAGISRRIQFIESRIFITEWSYLC